MKKNNGLFNPKGIFMRLSLIFCLLSTLCLTIGNAAMVKAQYGLDKRIDIYLKNSSFPELLKEIERKTGVSFIYTNKESVTDKVSISDQSKTARAILTPLLKKHDLQAVENGMMVDSYPHPWHMKVIKHLSYHWSGCGNHYMWVWSLNQCTVASFGTKQ